MNLESISQIRNAASYWFIRTGAALTHLTRMRRCYHLIFTGNEFYGTAGFALPLYYLVKTVFHATIGIFSDIPAAFCRFAGASIRANPFFINPLGNAAIEPTVIEKDGRQYIKLKISLKNTAGIEGGYHITDAGVIQNREKIGLIAYAALSEQPDIACFLEVHNTHDGDELDRIFSHDGYHQSISDVGTQAIGPNSGYHIISKHAVSETSFIPYPKDLLVGRTKNSAKGVLQTEIKSSSGVVLLTLFILHPQHSEEPAFPNEDEKKARRDQMSFLFNMCKDVEGPILVLGDFNSDTLELKDLLPDAWNIADVAEPTWGGDQRCTQYVKFLPNGDRKRPSGPLILDGAFGSRGSITFANVEVKDSNFDQTIFSNVPDSDHNLVSFEVYTEVATSFPL